MLPGQHLASVGMGLVCLAPPQANSWVPASPSPGTGTGTGRYQRLAGAWCGRPVARSRSTRRQIDALNYLARERKAAAMATPCVGARGHAHTRAWDPPHPAQTGWLGTHCQVAGSVHPPGVLCHPLGCWVPAAWGTPLPQHLSMPCWPCQAVPGWCHWHCLLCPPPRTTAAAPSWHHGVGTGPAGARQLRLPEGPPVFTRTPTGLPHLRRVLSHGRPCPAPPAPLASLL